jgi:hypothetical protein
MRKETSSPTLVPSLDVAVYLVLDDFGEIGRAYREAGEETSDVEAVINGMLSGEYTKPLRVVAFNTAEGWSRDVSENIAWEVLNRAVEQGVTLPTPTYAFVASIVGEDVALRAANALL